MFKPPSSTFLLERAIYPTVVSVVKLRRHGKKRLVPARLPAWDISIHKEMWVEVVRHSPLFLILMSPLGCHCTCVCSSPVRCQPGLLGWKPKTKQKTPEEAKARRSSGKSLFRDAVGTSWKKTTQQMTRSQPRLR